MHTRVVFVHAQMYVCIHEYMCVVCRCMHARIHVLCAVCTCVLYGGFHIYVHAYKYISIYSICACICMQVCVYLCGVCTHVCYVQIYMCGLCACTYICMCVCVPVCSVHVYVYVHVCVRCVCMYVVCSVYIWREEFSYFKKRIEICLICPQNILKDLSGNCYKAKFNNSWQKGFVGLC